MLSSNNNIHIQEESDEAPLKALGNIFPAMHGGFKGALNWAPLYRERLQPFGQLYPVEVVINIVGINTYAPKYDIYI